MNWTAYPDYQASGVDWLGDVPEGWKVKRLRFSIKTNPTKKEVSGFARDMSVSFVPMEAVGEYGGLCLDQTKSLEELSNGYTYFRNGDVLVAKITPCFENGKGAIASGLENNIGFGTTELHVLRPERDIDQRYLFYLTISHAFRHIGRGYMYGAGGQKRIPEDFIRNLKHPIPPINEQRLIAAFLDCETERIDTLIAKKERQIELLQEKRAALISQAVTKGLNPNMKMKDSGIEWLGEIPTYWELVPLKFLVVPRGDAVKTGPFGSQLLSSEMLSGTVKVYNQRNVLDRDFQTGENYVTDEKHAELRAFTICSGDLLITTRGTIGHCALFPPDAEPGILHPCLIRVQPDSRKIIPEYLAMLIQDSFLIKNQLALMSNATTIEVIYSDSLKRVKVPIPPVAEQKMILLAIGCKVGSLDKLSKIVERSINILREYRAALISAMVTGKIDVRKEVA